MLDSVEYSTPHWVTTAEVQEIICTSSMGPNGKDFCSAVRHKRNAGRGTGRLWYRPDVMEIARLKRVCRIGTCAAARVLMAYRQGNLDPKP